MLDVAGWFRRRYDPIDWWVTTLRVRRESQRKLERVFKQKLGM